MKKVLIVFCVATFIYACGSGGEGGAKTGSDAVATDTPASTPGPSTADLPSDKGLELIGASDCTTCHAIDRKIIGPAYTDVAKKYAGKGDAIVDSLVGKVKNGGAGVWGAIPMTPHPQLPDSDIREMVKYILTLNKK